nr:MAG TPA: hypothetical protein [Caudoviricetes sp.]
MHHNTEKILRHVSKRVRKYNKKVLNKQVFNK